MEIGVNLHAKQLEAYQSQKRFKVASCGRRGGKTYFAAFTLGIETLKNEQNGKDLSLEEVWGVAPTFDQAKGAFWNLLKEMWKDVIEKAHENTATLVFKNGRRLKLKGSDRPDGLRGAGLSFVAIDEFAFMKPEVWDLIIQPMLARSKGGALFTGTPDGKNHFYDLYLQGISEDDEWDDWESFNWGTKDNPEIPAEEIISMEQRMTKEAFIQEAMGKFVSGSSDYFKESYLEYADEPPAPGNYYIAIDPAGYDSGDALIASQLKKKDEFAIAVCHVSTAGWFVEDIIHGRWGIREASLQIMKAYKKYRPTKIGIEKGALKKAIEPYLVDQMRRLNIYFTPYDLSHGGKSKTDRIVWALQGRAEHGRLFLNKNKTDWHRPFIEQLMDFPNPMAHDDLIDALAYIDQLADTVYFDGFEDTNTIYDETAGY